MSAPEDFPEGGRTRITGGREGATRVFRGRTVEELVPQIQRELGSEAIILRRREGLTGGVFGFFQHPWVEIEAMPGTPGVDVYDEHIDQPFARALLRAGEASSGLASAVPTLLQPTAPDEPRAPLPSAPAFEPMRTGVEREAEPPQGAPDPFPSRASPQLPVTQPHATQPPASSLDSVYSKARAAALTRAERVWAPTREAPPRTTPSASAAETGRPRETGLWHGETAPRGSGLQELSESAVSALTAPPRVRAEAEPQAREHARAAHGRAGTAVQRGLRGYGISDELARDLVDAASAHALALAPRAGLAQAVRATLAQRIPVAPPLPASGATIVLVGAGGSGKTTCCAALLAAYRRSSSLSTHFVTILRGEGRDQLRVLMCPHLMTPTPARTAKALRALRQAREEGVAVVDTPNLSPSDRTGVRELAALLAELAPERVVVALPATLGAAAAEQLLRALEPLGANALAVTHADETDQIGVAIEAGCRTGVAPEYVLDRGRGGGWRLQREDPTSLAGRVLK
jgi:flagellar biosynthesis GTPase FlhF